jgi:hypothetical protein
VTVKIDALIIPDVKQMHKDAEMFYWEDAGLII